MDNRQNNPFYRRMIRSLPDENWVKLALVHVGRMTSVFYAVRGEGNNHFIGIRNRTFVYFVDNKSVIKYSLFH